MRRRFAGPPARPRARRCSTSGGNCRQDLGREFPERRTDRWCLFSRRRRRATDRRREHGHRKCVFARRILLLKPALAEFAAVSVWADHRFARRWSANLYSQKAKPKLLPDVRVLRISNPDSE